MDDLEGKNQPEEPFEYKKRGRRIITIIKLRVHTLTHLYCFQSKFLLRNQTHTMTQMRRVPPPTPHPPPQVSGPVPCSQPGQVFPLFTLWNCSEDGDTKPLFLTTDGKNTPSERCTVHPEDVSFQLPQNLS